MKKEELPELSPPPVARNVRIRDTSHDAIIAHIKRLEKQTAGQERRIAALEEKVTTITHNTNRL